MTIITLSAEAQSFISAQKKYARVRSAFNEKEEGIKANIADKGILAEDLNIVIVAYKVEKVVEIYGRSGNNGSCKLLETYDICASSGTLGPKLEQGDGQVPEGIYHIDRFNPASSYYLSLGINYPNKADRIKSTANKLGGDIFIHGSCVTIGCLPMTDDKIKEIYVYAVMARDNGQLKIPVYIFPFEMTDSKFDKYKKRYASKKEIIALWQNLKSGYDSFIEHKNELKFTIDKNGDYNFD